MKEARIAAPRMDGFRGKGEICSDTSACIRARPSSVTEVKRSGHGSWAMVKAYINTAKLPLSLLVNCPR